ncbi:MAG: hypothetical protein ACHREM_33125, partial [Polyangiales bacterium]
MTRSRLFFSLFVLGASTSLGCSALSDFDWSIDWNEVFSDLGSAARRTLPAAATAASTNPEDVDEAPLVDAKHAPQKPQKPKKPVAGAPVLQKSAVDLGVAYVPEDDPSGKKIPYSFDTTSFTPRTTRVAYAAIDDEVENVRKFYADYARS